VDIFRKDARGTFSFETASSLRERVNEGGSAASVQSRDRLQSNTGVLRKQKLEGTKTSHRPRYRRVTPGWEGEMRIICLKA